MTKDTPTHLLQICQGHAHSPIKALPEDTPTTLLQRLLRTRTHSHVAKTAEDTPTHLFLHIMLSKVSLLVKW